MDLPVVRKNSCKKILLCVLCGKNEKNYQITLELSRRIVTGPKLTSSTSMRA
jgi:hypothetical protein